MSPKTLEAPVMDESGENVQYDTMSVGTTWLFNVPPGWLIAGTIIASEVRSDGHEYLVLKDAIWSESVPSGKSPLVHLTGAETAKELVDIGLTTWPLPDGTVIRREAVLMSFPCKRDMQPLARSREADAIRRAR